MIKEFCGDFAKKFPEAASRFFRNVPMSNYSTFKVGGPADFLLSASSAQEILEAVKACEKKEIPLTIIGKGSNILVSDKGIRGLVLLIGKHMSAIKLVGPTTIEAEAGATFADLSHFAAAHNLSGLEFASGIPGTVGGAVFMNAGAYDGKMEDLVVSSVGLDLIENKIFEIPDLEGHLFGYRQSYFTQNKAIVLSTRLKLNQGEPKEIRAKMRDLSLRRSASQPLEHPSAGSTFKRPPGYYAGKLIQDAGLKGYRIGGACVSKKHAGFIVNDRQASAADIMDLVKYVQKTVFDKFGVKMETEIRILGEW